MTSRRARAVRLGLVICLVGGVAASGASSSGAAEVPPFPGALPDTASATTVSGLTGEFKDLAVKVNQTTDLTTQAVSVTWNWPGHATTRPVNPLVGGYNYDTDFLQVMQCWGNPVTQATVDSAPTAPPAAGEPSPKAIAAANYVEGNEGPPREQCEFGGAAQTGVAPALYANQPTRQSYAMTKTSPVAVGQETVYEPFKYSAKDPNGLQKPEVPFVAANGTTVPHQVAPQSDKNSALVYTNEFYDSVSTNESPANFVFPDGTGGTQFQVQNQLDSRGLGCGAPAATGGGLNKCWLVVVPRGSVDPVTGAPLRQGSAAKYSSPLTSTVWKNRIAIPLTFQPVQSSCSSGKASYGTSGSPLAAGAVLSWATTLCGGGNVFDYTSGVDAVSRDNLASGANSLQFVSQPVAPADATTAITYAPVTLSGVTISFVWDKAVLAGGDAVFPVAKPLPTIKLNQRLVAKLVTYSYIQANPYRFDSSPAASRDPLPVTYASMNANAQWLGTDPEFLALNPEFAGLNLDATNPIASVQASLNGSDGYAALWKWIMSDGSARDFLAGKPDESGMRVDPYFSTDAAINPLGSAFDPNVDYLPYADPWQGIPSAPSCGKDVTIPTLAMTDIRPAAKDITTVAKDILTLNYLDRFGQSYTCPGADVNSPSGGWKGTPPAPVIPGNRKLAGLSDTASSAQFGVSTASLRNADDQYVQPTNDSIGAAATHLAPTAVKGVSQPDVTVKDPAAYPLSLVTYAAVTTNTLPTAACSAYATLLDYAATDGQQSGTAVGQLPPGYVPLPTALRAETTQAARTVAACAKNVAPVDDPVDGPADPVPTDEAAPPPADTPPADAPADTDVSPAADAPVAAPSTAATTPSLAEVSRTKPDPSAFAYLVPIALGIGVLALLAAPLAGLRRRREDPPGGSA